MVNFNSEYESGNILVGVILVYLLFFESCWYGKKLRVGKNYGFFGVLICLGLGVEYFMMVVVF